MRSLQIVAISLAPVVAGIGLGLLLERQLLPNPLFSGEFHIDTAGIVSRLGFLIGLVIASVLFTALWAQRRADRYLQIEKNTQIEIRHRFFRRLDHELKNPLTIINLGIVNLQQEASLQADQLASLERMAQQVSRLQRLVRDLRWLSELEAHPLECQAVDMVDVIDEAVELATNLHPNRKLDVDIQAVPWPISPVNGDRDMLMLVFHNLLDNSLKYSAPEAQVTVRAADDGQWVTVEVADSGMGIAEAELPNIYEELYRGENTQGISGSGLGLALVWRIVKLHDGDIDVRSRESQGTIVRVRLPAFPA